MNRTAKGIILFFILGVSIACCAVGVFPVGIVGLVLSGFLWYKWFYKQKATRTMTGLEYEHWCAEQLLRSGKFRSATVTPASGDYGADIIAIDCKGQRWIIQCKKFSKNVDNSAVQEAVAAKAHYKADRAAVMTNKELTKKARELAWENAVELFEGFGD